MGRRVACAGRALLASFLGLGAGCGGSATRAPAHTESVVAPAPVVSRRSSRALCSGERCTLTVELVGNRSVPSEELFARMRVFEDVDYRRDTIERDVLVVNAYYYDHGYLGVSVKAEPESVKGCRGISC